MVHLGHGLHVSRRTKEGVSATDVDRDYKPELDRLAGERKAKTEAEKKAQLDRLMKDMSVEDRGSTSAASSSRSGRRRGGNDNPFGPHARNEREDM